MINDCATLAARRSAGRVSLPTNKKDAARAGAGPLRALCAVVLLISCASAATKPKIVLLPPPLSASPTVPAAVQAVSPFTILGFLQKATLDAPDDPLSGGTVTVNDCTIRVSVNTLVNLPGRYLKWSELFSRAPAPWGPRQTGLALADSPKPLTTYEVMVQGNRVISSGKDQYIAGLIFLSQQSLNSGQGFINFIDYATGEMRVGGTPNDPASGARVRLNDPLGRFGRVMSPDARFTVDEDNPTVRSATGYPMCIPRVNLAAATAAHPVDDDPLCPQSNRPRDSSGFLSFFTMPPPPCSAFAPLPSGTPSVAPPNCILNPAPGAPDATRQMPFEVGDYVTFQGTLQSDTTSPGCLPPERQTPPALNPACQYMSAWSVIANVGAFTAPGIMPAYVAVNVTLMGTGGIPNRGLPQEATSIARIEGFTTDPTQPVDIYGIDVDPCTRAATDRYWGTQPVQQIGQLGRFRFLPLGGTFTPPVRDIRAVSQTLSQGAIPATVVFTSNFANGLIAGQYETPMTQFIFPESAEVGLARIPLNFQDFPFLAGTPVTATTGGVCAASVAPASLNFSDQPLGVASAPQTVILKNAGIGVLNINNVSISPGYSQANDCGAQLPVGASCTFAVRFLPTSLSAQSGVLQITDTATGSPQAISLIGSVAQPPIVPPPVPPIGPTPPGPTPPGPTPPGPTPPGPPPTGPTPPGPPTSGPTPPGSPPGAPSPLVVLGADSLSFPDEAPGSVSAAQAVSLTNRGTAPLKIVGTAIGPGYAQANDCGSVLPAGANCTFIIRFAPTVTGAHSAALRIADNAAGSPHTIALTGTASDFVLGADTGAAMSAAVLPGETASYRLRVTGSSLASGPVNLSCSGLPDGGTCQFSPAAVTLNGARSQSLMVSIGTDWAAANLNTAQGSKAPRTFPLALTLLSGVAAAVFTRKRHQCALSILALCALMLSGCGSGPAVRSRSSSTSALTHRVTVTAAGANGAVHQVRLTLRIVPPAPRHQPVTIQP